MKLLEEGVLSVGRGRLPYALFESRKRREIAAGFDAEAGVIMVAPRGTAADHLRKLLRTNSPVFFSGVKRAKQLVEMTQPHKHETGERYLYLGRWHTLHVLHGPEAEDGAAKLIRGRLIVTLPRTIKGRKRTTKVQQAIGAFYWRHAGGHVFERIGGWAKRMKIPIPEVTMHKLDDAWGGYDPAHVVYFDWRIIQAPLELLDYVIVHELAHYRVPNHGPRFWSCVKSVMPDYQVRADALHNMEPVIRW